MKYTNRELEKIDYMNPFIPYKSGFYEISVAVGEKTRKVMWYLPESIRPSTSGILLVPPSGVSIDEFLEKSNWIEIADAEETKEGLAIAVVEASEDGWNLNESYGDENGDIAYINAACQLFSIRNTACIHEAKRYLLGYGDGASAAMMAAMCDPAAYAAVAAVDAADIPSEFIAASEDDYALNLYGYADPEHRHDIKKGDIPVPMYFVSEKQQSDNAIVKHFCKACGCDETPVQIDTKTIAFTRSKDTEYPVNQDKECYKVWVGEAKSASENLGKSVNRKIWKSFLATVQRWMGDPAGDLRVTADPVHDLGAEYHYKEIGGFMREWYVYEPDMVKEHPLEAAPLVFACHGYSCSGEIYIGNSGGTWVADDYGFIVAFPTATPGYIGSGSKTPEGGVMPDNIALPTWHCKSHEEGRPYEIDFFEYMINDICASHEVDKKRIFITGHSNGSMITSWLSLTKPEWFAAAAPCSGILHMITLANCLEEEEVKNRPDVDIPMWMQGGDEEKWLLEGYPENNNRTEKSIKDWWILNKMPGNPPTDYRSIVVRNDRWNDWFFDKDRIPMLRYSSIDYMPHATMPEQSYRIWEDFFSHFSREEDGSVKYSF